LIFRVTSDAFSGSLLSMKTFCLTCSRYICVYLVCLYVYCAGLRKYLVNMSCAVDRLCVCISMVIRPGLSDVKGGLGEDCYKGSIP
jgi:hypothetical protein